MIAVIGPVVLTWGTEVDKWILLGVTLGRKARLASLMAHSTSTSSRLSNAWYKARVKSSGGGTLGPRLMYLACHRTGRESLARLPTYIGNKLE